MPLTPLFVYAWHLCRQTFHLSFEKTSWKAESEKAWELHWFFFPWVTEKLWHLRKILHRIHKNGVFRILVAKQMPSGIQLQNTGIRWILWMFNHVHKWVTCNMHRNVRCKYQAWWDVHVASHEKCGFSVPLGGVLAFKGIRKILLQQVPHHCHAPPV